MKLRGKKQATRRDERRSAALGGPAYTAPGSQNPHKGRAGITRTSANAGKLRSKAAAR